MRIIAGQYGGRRLSSPEGRTTRPTGDRVKEALFSILGAPPEDARVLDLFAGSGNLGLEALSRGAKEATFVERDRRALTHLRSNIKSLDVVDSTTLHCMDALRALALFRRDHRRFDWLFLDPPYQSSDGPKALEELGQGGLLGPEALVVFEHDRRFEAAERVGSLVKDASRTYGDTSLTFYRRTGL